MADPIPIRVGAVSEHDWPTRMALYAVAFGRESGRAMLRATFGPGVDFPELWDHASAAWKADPLGLHVTVHQHPTLRPYPPAHAGPDCILFDPWDDGHDREPTDDLAIAKRSMPCVPAANEIACPAWPRTPTLDLACGPAPDAELPIVSFCGVAHRPAVRADFIDCFDGNTVADVRIIRRRSFCHPDPAAFLDSIRQAHCVLCPPGAGRFSYRLYETLAAGRIPVVPSGEHTIPPQVLHNAHISFAASPGELLEDWRTVLRPQRERIHQQNRDAWVRFASPLGSLVWLADEVRKRLEAVT